MARTIKISQRSGMQAPVSSVHVCKADKTGGGVRTAPDHGRTRLSGAAAHNLFVRNGRLYVGQLGVRDEAVVGQRATGACDFVSDEELRVFLQAGDHADMRLLDVEVERTRHRVFTRSDGFGRGRHTAHGGDLELVGVVLVESEAEHADAVGVRVDARQRLGVVAVDVHGLAVGAHVEAGILGVVLGHAAVHHRLHRAGFLTADQQNLLFEDFARAVLGAGDEHGDFRVGQIAVELGPAVVRVGNDLAVLEHLRADGVEDVGRLEFGEGGAGLLAGEHDAVIADAHFDDVGHAVIGTGLDLFFADGARGVGDVDGV